jgi:hypothetical protein
MTTSTIYWQISSDLGPVKSNNNCTISIAVYDPEPFLGPVRYSISSGSLPPALNFEPELGYIWGHVDYQSVYEKDYSLTINATKNYSLSGELFTATNTFTLTVRANIDTSIEWVSTSSLGSIEVGTNSEIFVSAKGTNNYYNNVKYSLIDGSLPNGLSVEPDGSLSGSPAYGSTGTYTFAILATDIYNLTGIPKDFTLSVFEVDDTEYTKIYCRPFLSQQKRKYYQDFITNSSIFPPELIYRYFDKNFGIQPTIKLILDFGIERVPLEQYTQALRSNYYRRRFYFGDVKIAVATDDLGTPIYEVVYVDIVDNIQGSSSVFYQNNKIYNPASIENMRRQLSLIQLDDYSLIKVNRFLEPRYMQSPQPGNLQPPGYLHVIPLCYALPGQGRKITQRIRLSGFDFKLIDFEIDRIIVENSLDNTSAKYLLFERSHISDEIATDLTLYQGDVLWQFENGPQLTRT